MTTNELSKREREVLALLVKGVTPKDIAARLCIEVSTVRSHQRRIYRKVGIKRCTQLFTEVIRN